MGNHLNEYTPDYAVTPGEVLEHELEIRGMSQQELANRTGLTPKHLIAILKAKASITPDTAIKFERALGMPCDYWLNLEANYREVLARLAEEEQLAQDLDWLKRVPVNEMAKLGWLNKYKDKKAQLVELLNFFGIAEVKQWKQMWPKLSIAYRQHNKHEIFPESVSAWLRQGELRASAIVCEPFDKSHFRTVLEQVRTMTTVDPDHFVPELQRLCAEAGVAVVFVPALSKTSISGATRWLNKDKALIQLSLRYKSDDHLWFTFFHEAGHILLHGKKEMFLEESNGLDPEKEQEANHFAEAQLIPPKAFTAFIAEGAFSKRRISEFAVDMKISPGIVVGQLQHRGLLDMKFCNDLKRRFKWAHE